MVVKSRKWVCNKNSKLLPKWNNQKKKWKFLFLKLCKNLFQKRWSHQNNCQLQSTMMDSKFKNLGVRRRIEKFRRCQARFISRLPKLVKEEVADVAKELKSPSLLRSSNLKNHSRKICRPMIPIIKEWWHNINRCKINRCLNQLQCHSRSPFRCICRQHQSWVNNRITCNHSPRLSCPLQCHSPWLLLQQTPSQSLNKMHSIVNSRQHNKIKMVIIIKITTTMNMVMMTITTKTSVQVLTNLTL